MSHPVSGQWNLSPQSAVTDTQVPSSVPEIKLPSKADVEIRSTALHYALKIVGERNVDSEQLYTNRVVTMTSSVETYLRTGKFQ